MQIWTDTKASTNVWGKCQTQQNPNDDQKNGAYRSWGILALKLSDSWVSEKRTEPCNRLVISNEKAFNQRIPVLSDMFSFHLQSLIYSFVIWGFLFVCFWLGDCFGTAVYNFQIIINLKWSQSCLTLCGSMDCSPPGFSIHGVFQTRILEWVAISFSRGSSPPRDRTQVSCI